MQQRAADLVSNIGGHPAALHHLRCVSPMIMIMGTIMTISMRMYAHARASMYEQALASQ